MAPSKSYFFQERPQYRDRAIRIERDVDVVETIMIDNDILLKGRLPLFID